MILFPQTYSSYKIENIRTNNILLHILTIKFDISLQRSFVQTIFIQWRDIVIRRSQQRRKVLITKSQMSSICLDEEPLQIGVDVSIYPDGRDERREGEEIDCVWCTISVQLESR